MIVDLLTLKTIGGAIAGCLWGGFGYALARGKGEPFEPKKFGKTVLVGFILGLIATQAGVDIATVEGFSTLSLVTILSDKVTSFFK